MVRAIGKKSSNLYKLQKLFNMFKYVSDIIIDQHEILVWRQTSNGTMAHMCPAQQKLVCTFKINHHYLQYSRNIVQKFQPIVVSSFGARELDSRNSKEIDLFL